MSSVRSMRVLVAAVVFSALTALVGLSPAAAQTSDRSFELSGEVTTLRLSELGVTNVGVGADAAWRVAPALLVDGALTWFPGNGHLGADPLAGQRRLLGLIGVKSGIALDRVELLGHVRAGFLDFFEEGPIPCPAIFPVPLECQLAQGYTAFAADFGGSASVSLDAARRLRLHVDAGDLVVRYGLNAFRSGGAITDGFVSHNLLMSAGLGWRF
jgi:hypothetical protein